jgi:hypothetical protein
LGFFTLGGRFGVLSPMVNALLLVNVGIVPQAGPRDHGKVSRGIAAR